MLYDTHMHTEISRDSDARLTDYIRQARDMGIGITPTEHLDIDHPEGPCWIPDFERYFADYAKYRGKGVYLGIEIGMQQSTAERSRAIVERYSFDYILCSQHLLGGEDLISDSLYERDKRDVFREYLSEIAANLPLHDYLCSLAHIDYISRDFCAKYKDREIHYQDYASELDAILLWLARHDKAIEINTRRFPHAQAISSLRAILKRFAELGGQYCTLGSDSHTADAVGRQIREACNLGVECGLRPVYFVERQPVLMKLV